MAAPVSPSDPQFITAAFWKTEVTDRWTNLYSAWTSYTSSWTAANSNPSVGNGTLTAAYKRNDVAKTVQIRLRLVTGSSTGYGSGAWSFSLPSGLAPSSFETLSAHVLDASSANRWAAVCYLSGANGIERIAVDASLGVSATNPMTWAINDQLLISGTYEIS